MGWSEAPENREQMALFPHCLDEAIGKEHVVRFLDAILSEINWSSWETEYHGRLGQPAIHPRVIASVLLYGLLTRIRSSRALEEALQIRLDFRWLVSGRSIDHTTICQFRKRHEDDLRDLFVQVGLLARNMHLAKLDRLAFDGTRIRANNRRSGTRTPSELRQEAAELEEKFAQFEREAQQMDAGDEQRMGAGGTEDLPSELRDAQQRRSRISAALEELNRAREAGEKLPPRLPLTDPNSRVMPNKEGGFAPNYTPTATVDVASGLIVNADVLPVVNEASHLIAALDQVQEDFELPRPAEGVLADGLMSTGANLAALEERGITLYSPCKIPDPATNPALREDLTQPVAEADWDRLPTTEVTVRGQKATVLDKSAFGYDADRDCYWCPAGKTLNYKHSTSESTGSGQRVRDRYFAEVETCQACPLRDRCVHPANKKSRQINREQYEAHRERHAKRMATPEAQQIYNQRRHAGERPFATIKQRFGLRQFLTRGLKRVQAEWHLAATAFNIHRMYHLLHAPP
jgi:transposase